MDSERFDAVVRAWMAATPRRTVLGLVAGSAFGLAGLDPGSARGKKKHRRKKAKPAAPPVSPPPASPPPPPPTEPTCAPYLASCIPDGDCCSGTCVYFDLALNYCDRGSLGSACHDVNDCLSGSCQGYRCV